MTPTRKRFLLAVALAVGAVTFALSFVVYGSLPALPRGWLASLVLLVVAEAPLAATVRARVAGRPRTKPIAPLVVARYAVLAKASALFAAISTGFWGGLLAFVALRRDDFPRYAARDLLTSGLTAGVSLLLVAVALRLENACKVPPSPPPSQEVAEATEG